MKFGGGRFNRSRWNGGDELVVAVVSVLFALEAIFSGGSQFLAFDHSAAEYQADDRSRNRFTVRSTP